MIQSISSGSRRKERLTITLSPDLVRRVDALIDRRTIRSRSHAIETLLRKSLPPTVDTAVILGGGRGRTRPSTLLTPIRGRPLITLTLEHLLRHGIRSMVILAGPREDEIRYLLGDGSEEGAEITYVREERPLGTAGALTLAAPHLAGRPFLVVNGDVLTDIDLSALCEFHHDEKLLATMAVKPRQAEKRYGKALLQGSRIVEFNERGRKQGVSIVNTGVYLFEPEILSLIEEEEHTSLETEVFPALAKRGELAAFFFQGIWFDISTPGDRRLAEARWHKDGGR